MLVKYFCIEMIDYVVDSLNCGKVACAKMTFVIIFSSKIMGKELQ